MKRRYNDTLGQERFRSIGRIKHPHLATALETEIGVARIIDKQKNNVRLGLWARHLSFSDFRLRCTQERWYFGMSERSGVLSAIAYPSKKDISNWVSRRDSEYVTDFPL